MCPLFLPRVLGPPCFTSNWGGVFVGEDIYTSWLCLYFNVKSFKLIKVVWGIDWLRVWSSMRVLSVLLSATSGNAALSLTMCHGTYTDVVRASWEFIWLLNTFCVRSHSFHEIYPCLIGRVLTTLNKGVTGIPVSLLCGYFFGCHPGCSWIPFQAHKELLFGTYFLFTFTLEVHRLRHVTVYFGHFFIDTLWLKMLHRQISLFYEFVYIWAALCFMRFDVPGIIGISV